MALQGAAHRFPLELLQGLDKNQHAGRRKTVKNNIFGKVSVFSLKPINSISCVKNNYCSVWQILRLNRQSRLDSIFSKTSWINHRIKCQNHL